MSYIQQLGAYSTFDRSVRRSVLDFFFFCLTAVVVIIHPKDFLGSLVVVVLLKRLHFFSKQTGKWKSSEQTVLNPQW